MMDILILFNDASYAWDREMMERWIRELGE